MLFISDDPSGSQGNRLAELWRFRPALFSLLLFYAAYVATGFLCDGLALIPGVSIIFWPPVGILIATLLLNPRITWPWWIITGCAAELTCNALLWNNPLHFALIYYSGNALESLTAAWLIGRFASKPFRFETFEQVAAFVVLGAGIAPMVSATVIATTDALRGRHLFTTAWPLVWLGDGTGLLVSAPLTFAVVQAWRARAEIPFARMVEAVSILVVLVVIGELSLMGYLPTVYMIMPPLLWAAVRFQLEGAAIAVGLVTLMSAFSTLSGRGEFSGQPDLMYEKIVTLQTFLGISAVSALFVGALSQQRQQALYQLKSANTELEAHVAERTESLREREQLLRLFVEHAPAAIAMFDNNMRYLAVSKRWMTDYRLHGDIVNRSHYEVLPEIPERWKEVHRRALAGEVQHCDEDMLERIEGPPIWTKWEVRPWLNARDEIGGIIIATEDITERKRSEETLRESEQRFRLLADSAPALIWINGPDGAEFVNRTYRDFVGVSEEEVHGYDWAKFIHPEDREKYVEAYLLAGERRGPFDAEFRFRRHNGEYRWMRSVAQPRVGSGGEFLGYAGISFDITERKHVEDVLKNHQQSLEQAVKQRTKELAELNGKLRAENKQRRAVEKERVMLLRQLVTAQENERRRIARDLHDDLGQQLTALSLKVELALRGSAENDDIRGHLEGVHEITKSIDKDLDFLAWQLRPAVLDDNGFVSELRRYVEDWSNRYEVTADFWADSFFNEQTGLAIEAETNLYRIAQEALNNIAKYANASHVDILLKRLDDHAILMIEDNGSGFDTSSLRLNKNLKSMGLIGMRERATLVRGNFEIESAPNRGTSIRVSIPLSNAFKASR